MNQEIIQKLKDWRSKKANLEGVERYVILHNKTIEEIAETLPKNEEEFKAIKGLGGKKFEKYGEDILAIVNECTDNHCAEEEKSNDEGIFTVSHFLNIVNSKLVDLEARVKGEISSVDFRSTYLFFTIKDLEEEASVKCFMWTRDYEISGIELKEGLEVIVHGIPEVFPRSGSFSLRSDLIELVGEGVLKKKYDELKRKLAGEGVFEESRKRTLPAFPNKIGVITSKHGAVINDLLSNLGRFGFKISLYDSRVEGALAVRDLIEGTRYFRNKQIDVLVVIRGGGGNLEILQAFNNEALIREIIDYPVPVICGIGHDKDVPLFSMAADIAVSTPSMVARELNRNFEQAIDKIGRYESNILGNFSSLILDNNHRLNSYFHQFNSSFQKIVQKISAIDRIISNILNQFRYAIKNKSSQIDRSVKNIVDNYSGGLTACNNRLSNVFKLLQQNDPTRQLKLGYSIVFSGDKVIKSIQQVNEGEIIINKVSDGEISSSVEDIKSKE